MASLIEVDSHLVVQDFSINKSPERGLNSQGSQTKIPRWPYKKPRQPCKSPKKVAFQKYHGILVNFQGDLDSGPTFSLLHGSWLHQDPFPVSATKQTTPIDGAIQK